MNNPRLVDLQRQRWVPDQLLRSRDLRDQQATSDQLRWWHNRAVHEAFGVASGLQATLAGQLVTVEPGVAYDCFGQPLRLRTRRGVPVPSGLGPFTLLARAGPSGDGEPELVWRETRGLDRRDGVPVTRLRSSGSTPQLEPVPSGARPLAGPRLGWGSTPSEGTAWEPWHTIGPTWESWFRSDSVIGLQVAVDTSAAGFTEVPCYFAWLQWPTVGSTQLNYWLYVQLGFQYVEEPAIDRFVFRVLLLPFAIEFLRLGPGMPRVLGREREGGEALVSFAAGQRLSLCWLGVQAEGEGTSNGP
jgi:hypothetical protein